MRPDGSERTIDALNWYTGCRPALDHLAPLGIVEADGRVAITGTHNVGEPRRWIVGDGA